MRSNHFRHFTLLLIVIHAAIANAQVWCPPGAVWHHNYAAVSAPLVGVVRTECIGDTVIQGETAKLKHATASGYDWQNGGTFQSDLGFVITKANADQVSFWDGSDWFLLYDLGLPVGGQWLLVCYLDAFELTVTGTGLKIVDGIPLRYSVVSLDPPLPWLASDTVIERIGFKSIYVHPYSFFGSWSNSVVSRIALLRGQRDRLQRPATRNVRLHVRCTGGSPRRYADHHAQPRHGWILVDAQWCVSQRQRVRSGCLGPCGGKCAHQAGPSALRCTRTATGCFRVSRHRLGWPLACHWALGEGVNRSQGSYESEGGRTFLSDM